MQFFLSYFSVLFRTNLKLIAFMILITLFLILVVSGFYGFPISMGDKEGFYPVIYNLNSTNDFSHPFMCYTCDERMGNPLNTKFTNHGFLFPIIQSSLLFFNEYHKIETSSSLIFLINGFVFICLINLKNKRHFLVFIITISVYLYQIGRPELVISLILAVDWYLTKKQYFNSSIIFPSFISAVIFCVSPVALILYFPYMALKNNFHKINTSYYWNYLYYILTPLFILITFHLFVNQFTFLEWIKGILGASNHYHPANILPGEFYEKYGHSSLNEYFTYLFKGSRFLPLLFIGIFICFFGLAKQSMKSNRIIKFFTLLFIALLIWFGLRRPIFIYNIVAFIPFILLILDNENNLVSKINNTLLSIFAFACASSIIFYSMIIPIYTLNNGKKVEDLRDSMHKVSKFRTVQLPKQFWMHSRKTKNIGFLYASPNSKETDHYFGTKGLYADILYFSGYNLKRTRNDVIPEIEGYCIDEVNLNLSKIKLFDYSYLKYERCN